MAIMVNCAPDMAEFGSQDVSDLRDTPRRRVLKGGQIIVNELYSSFQVTIRDMSESGVKLKLHASWIVPARFELLINNPNTGIPVRRQCEKRWQRGITIGARFLDVTPPELRGH